MEPEPPPHLSLRYLHGDHAFNTPIFALHASLAGIGAVAMAQLLGLRYPLYALIAAVLVADSSLEQTVKMGTQRLIGTAVGALLGAGLSVVFGNALWAIGLGIFLTIFSCRRIGLKEAARLSGYVAGLVVMEHSASPWHYALFRFLETALGIVFAFVVGVILQYLCKTRWHAMPQHSSSAGPEHQD